QLTDLADRAGMSLATVHRLVRSMVAAGLVEQDPRTSRYGLGPHLVCLSERYLARLPVLNAASPYLGQLRDALGATVHVAVLARGHVVYVDRVDGGDAGGVFRETSRMRHAFATPAGRLLIARAGADEWRLAEAALRRADGLRRPTAAERQGWARAEYLAGGADSDGAPFEVAVPISDGRRAVASLAASNSGDEADLERLEARFAAQLGRVAQAVARTLGHV
ncbi:MAG TPA: helix-turn-helix domain-containing protein, partial [Solirubrobacteraceae bacterium]|nr:helix-turn-helix domain-containing protein [Solirubrobacteraceae bacterium]